MQSSAEENIFFKALEALTEGGQRKNSAEFFRALEKMFSGAPTYPQQKKLYFNSVV